MLGRSNQLRSLRGNQPANLDHLILTRQSCKSVFIVILILLNSSDDCNWSAVSIYSLSDLGVSCNLIGSLSRSNWALFTPYGVNNAWSKQNKMAGVNSRFATISEAEILKIHEDAAPENTRKATKKCCCHKKVLLSIYSISINSGRIFASISKNNC